MERTKPNFFLVPDSAEDLHACRTRIHLASPSANQTPQLPYPGGGKRRKSQDIYASKRPVRAMAKLFDTHTPIALVRRLC